MYIEYIKSLKSEQHSFGLRKLNKMLTFNIFFDSFYFQKSLVNENGIYNASAPEFLKGKNVLNEGNTLLLEHLKNDILFSDTLTHSYPLDWRTKKPVIIRASEQWFINSSELKDRAMFEVPHKNKL